MVFSFLFFLNKCPAVPLLRAFSPYLRPGVDGEQFIELETKTNSAFVLGSPAA